MPNRLRRIVACALLGWTGCALAACDANPIALAPPSTRWVVTSSLIREEDPGTAATEAAKVARQRLGHVEARAVIFFECFHDIDASEEITGAISLVFPQARVIGCSAAGVGTTDGATDDRGIAMLVLGGADPQISTAFMPGTAESADDAGRELVRQLGPTAGAALLVLLVDPKTVQQSAWDPNDLLNAVGSARGGPALIFGGLAALRGQYGIGRIYHQQRGYTDGVVAMQISGGLEWKFDTRQELLPVGPVWRARQVKDYVVPLLASAGGAQPAEAVLRKFLPPNELSNGLIGRIVGDRYVPLHFATIGEQAIRLRTRPRTEERMQVLQGGTRAGRIRAMRAALASTSIARSTLDGLPLSLIALPPGERGDLVRELPLYHRELELSAHAHPVSIAFMGPGQFAPVRDAGGQLLHHYFEHTTAVVQVGRAKNPHVYGTNLWRNRQDSPAGGAPTVP